MGSVSIGTDTGYNFGGGFGTTVSFLPESWTLGAQVLYTSSGISTVGAAAVTGGSLDNSTLSVMGVVNYHFDTGSDLGLYVGGGLGILQKDLSATLAGTTITLSDRQFGWQGQVGMDYPIAENTKLFAEYRYQGSLDWDINFPAGLGLPVVAISINQNTHNITMGIRFAM